MVIINVPCPDCGTVSVGAPDIGLWLSPLGSDGDFYTFTCPRCRKGVAKPADAHAVCLLMSGGVQGHVLEPPRRMGRDRPRSGAPHLGRPARLVPGPRRRVAARPGRAPRAGTGVVMALAAILRAAGMAVGALTLAPLGARIGGAAVDRLIIRRHVL